MADAQVNTIFTVGFQIQDLIVPDISPILNRQNINVIFPSVTTVYDGYYQATDGLQNLLDGTSIYAIIYLRNVGAAAVQVSLTGVTPSNLIQFWLNPGGISLTANNNNTNLNLFNIITQVNVGSTVPNAAISVEYLFAK